MKRYSLFLGLLLIFGLGLGIRLYDLTDPPFDFHATRQLRAAVIARGMYYQDLENGPEPERSIAIEQRQREALIEPPIIEWLVSRIYLVTGGVNLWVARILSSLFWIAGGFAVYHWGRDISGKGGGLLALVYFLFLPFGMIASRSFQPDPLMAGLIAASGWTLNRWAQTSEWRAAIWAGIFSGLAILVKLVAIIPLGFGVLALIFFDKGVRKSLRDKQIWAIAGIVLFPIAVYYINGLFISGFLADQTSHRFFPAMWIDPAFYIRWIEMTTDIHGFAIILIGLVGVILISKRNSRSLLAGMWLGYILYGFIFPFHITTHDYYQLLLTPIAAVSLAPAAHLVLEEVKKSSYKNFSYLALVFIIGFAVLFKVWDARVILIRKDYRTEVSEWRRFQEIIPPGKSVVAMTRAYGLPLAYYGWTTTEPWLSNADAELRSLGGQTEEEIQARRFNRLKDKDLFLITNFNEFENQPELQDYLYGNFEVFLEGEDFLIFDLNP